MEIRTRLITDGSAEVNAVLIYDEGAEYPVFCKSLLNNVMFPELLASGYKYTKMPYGFIKDGVAFDDLPVQNYECTEEELENMYNSIGVKLDDAELKKNMSPKEAKPMPTPTTNYTVFTRDAFLSYLEALETVQLETDIMPINYFVHPDALFTIEEYTSPKNSKWRNLIEQRRNMSLKSFQLLVQTLQKINLPANYNTLDVIDAYFAWGIDGIKLTIVDKKRESRPYALTANTSVRHEVVNHIDGFIDNQGNYLIPQDRNNIPWKPAVSDPTNISALTRSLGEGDTALMDYKATGRQDVTVLMTPQFNITYSDSVLVMLRHQYSTITIKSPTRINSTLPLKYALPNAGDKLHEYLVIDAMARDIFEARKVNVDVSSYKALMLSSLDPAAALKYIFINGGLTKLEKANADDEAFDTNLINDYINGEMKENNANYDTITDVIEGVQNIDKTLQGQAFDNGTDATSIKRELQAIHDVFDMSFEEMYRVIRSMQPEQPKLVFSKGRFLHTMNTKPLKGKLGGYSEDMHTYDDENAQNSTFIIYVTHVAREVGIESATRHVGMEFLMVNRTKNNVNTYIDRIARMFVDRCESMVQDSGKRAALLKKKYTFACNRYFEIAMKGTITWPAVLGGAVEPAPEGYQEHMQKTLEMKIESLVAYCKFTINDSSEKKVKMNGFCVNAQITTTHVIPRNGCTIYEAPLFTLWFNWAEKDVFGNFLHYPVYKALMDNNVLPDNWVAWCDRYQNCMFKKRSIYSIDTDQTSLMYIYNKAWNEHHNYPANKEFIAVHHPVEYLYKGLHEADPDFADMADLPVPRQGIPNVRLGLTRRITLDDYKHILRPKSIEKSTSDYIRPYTGMSAEIIMNVPDALDKLPESTEDSQLFVHRSSQTIHVIGENKVIDFRRIGELDAAKHRIVNIYGNMYLFRDVKGVMWEAVL